jgi:hypothetical protein
MRNVGANLSGKMAKNNNMGSIGLINFNKLLLSDKRIEGWSVVRTVIA